jgi:hypothetical protein
MTTNVFSKKIGVWRWALTGEEAMVALVVTRCLREKTPVDKKMQLRYEEMIEKQRKLLAREKAA